MLYKKEHARALICVRRGGGDWITAMHSPFDSRDCPFRKAPGSYYCVQKISGRQVALGLVVPGRIGERGEKREEQEEGGVASFAFMGLGGEGHPGENNPHAWEIIEKGAGGSPGGWYVKWMVCQWMVRLVDRMVGWREGSRQVCMNMEWEVEKTRRG